MEFVLVSKAIDLVHIYELLINVTPLKHFPALNLHVLRYDDLQTRYYKQTLLLLLLLLLLFHCL